jgi:Fic family protein
MNDRGKMPELVQCALIHEHFEAIHPFLDGNGRIGRLLITLFLIERGRLSKPLLYLSSYIEQHKTDYYALLQSIRTHGNWSGWFQYFLTAVRDTSRSAINQSQSILELRDTFRKKLHKQHKAMQLLDELFINPYTTVSRTAAQLGVTAPTAFKTIGFFEKVRMLEEMTGKGWGRVWVAKPILEAVDGTETIK